MKFPRTVDDEDMQLLKKEWRLAGCNVKEYGPEHISVLGKFHPKNEETLSMWEYYEWGICYERGEDGIWIAYIGAPDVGDEIIDEEVK